jgi:hypothetical protein
MLKRKVRHKLPRWLDEMDPLLLQVELRYRDPMARDDIEQSEFKNEDVELPSFGAAPTFFFCVNSAVN